MADAGGRITLANPTACRILGRSEDALVGRDLAAALGATHPLTELWKETMSGRGARERSEVRLDSDARGDRYLVLADPVPRGKEAQAAVLTLRNSDSMRKLTSLLDESHRMIAWGQVALGVAHEIKNPLQAMNLNLELAREKIARHGGDVDMSAPMRNLNVVGQQIRRLDDVVNGFLRFARMTHAEREPLNINGILSEVVSLVGSEGEKQGVEIRFTPLPGLPTVWGDRGLLYQAFLNVIQNAIQAGPHRGPIVVTSELAARGGVRVAIQDQGRGISRGDQGRVFDLFYTTRDNGSGIGLSIVQRVFALHGGQVELSSREGEGTTVATWLPLNVPLNRPHEAFSGDRQGVA
jgi:signal transduction histidine kinase